MENVTDTAPEATGATAITPPPGTPNTTLGAIGTNPLPAGAVNTPPMCEAAPEVEKVRKTPKPGETFIGQWTTDGDGARVFILSKQIPRTLQEKEIREVLKDLGPGTYDIIKGRTSEAVYGTKTVDEFVIGE